MGKLFAIKIIGGCSVLNWQLQECISLLSGFGNVNNIFTTRGAQIDDRLILS
jgi:hypothetical protein